MPAAADPCSAELRDISRNAGTVSCALLRACVHSSCSAQCMCMMRWLCEALQLEIMGTAYAYGDSEGSCNWHQCVQASMSMFTAQRHLYRSRIESTTQLPIPFCTCTLCHAYPSTCNTVRIVGPSGEPHAISSPTATTTNGAASTSTMPPLPCLISLLEVAWCSASVDVDMCSPWPGLAIGACPSACELIQKSERV